MTWIARLTLLGSLAACGPASDSAVIDTADTASLEADHSSASRQLRPAVRTPTPSTPDSPSVTLTPAAPPTVAPPAAAAAPAAPVATPPTAAVVVMIEEITPAPAEAVAVTVAPEPKCAVHELEGCYWMENTSGNYCWVPWTDTDLAQCKRLDSCDGGDGWSGGGCYKWSDGSSGARAPWPATPAPEQGVLDGAYPDDIGHDEVPAGCCADDC